MTARLNYVALLTLLFLGALVAASPVNAKQLILNIVDCSVSLNADGEILTIEELQFATLKGCTARGWRVRDQGGPMLVATLRVREKHLAAVEIPYSKEHYSINYLSSENLG